MSSVARLDQELLERFDLVGRLHAPSMLHRRAIARPARQPGARPLVLSWASHGPLTPEVLSRQRLLATQMQTPRTPLLTAVTEFKFEPEYHWMAAEMPPGRDLRDILRVQQRLSVEQVEWLVSMLGEALRVAVEQCWPRLSLEATQVMVDFENNAATVLMPDMPLFGGGAAAQADSLQTMAFNPASLIGGETVTLPEDTREYVTPLATLCAEMLGATAGGGAQNERFRAIPTLTIYQNTLLRSALAGAQRHSFESLDEFVSQFLGGGENGSATGLRRPAPHHLTARITGTGGAPQAATTAPTAASAAVAPAPAPAAVAPVVPEAAAPVDLAPPPGYVITQELRSSEAWRLNEATHPTFGSVLITSLDVSAEVGEALRRLGGLMQTLQQGQRAELLRPVDVQGGPRVLHVARPLPPGRTLLDALRERRSFSRPTVARLLATIHASYEALWGLVERKFVATSLGQFWLPPGKNDAGSDEGGLLLLDAAQLVLESTCAHAAVVERPVAHFARLALLLLGQDAGELSGEGPARFSPVPELSAETNGMLRRAIAPDQTGDLTLPRLLAQLTAALAGHTAVAKDSRPVLQVPEDLRNAAPQPATRLRLRPVESGQPIIALVAEDAVWMGRASTHSDYVAQLRPSNPVNDNRTRLISRAQAKVFMQNGQIFLSDIGTTNPSFTAGHRVGSQEIAELPMTLTLAGEYPLEIRPLRSAYATPGPAVTGWPVSKHRALRRGACALYSLDRGTLPFEVAWIFTDASLTTDTTGRLVFDDSDPTNSAVRFHHHTEGFWVEATAASMVDLNGRRLATGEVAPLNPGDDLRILGQAFQVQAYTLESTAKVS